MKRFVNLLLLPLRPISLHFGLSAVGSFLGGAASALAPVAAPIISGLFGSRDTDKTNQTNKDVASDNLQFQRENLDWQKAVQEKQWQREDSSYQRTVADMRQAGLSPLAMNGTDAAGEAVSTVAPQNTYQRQGKDYSWLSQGVNQGISTVIDMMRLKNEKAQSDAQVEKTNAETAHILADTDFFNASAGTRLAGLMLDNKNKGANYVNTVSNSSLTRLRSIGEALSNMSRADTMRYNRYFGINPDMSEKERLASLALKMSGLNGGLTKNDARSVLKDLSGFATQSDKNAFTNVADFLFTPTNPVTAKIADKLDNSPLNGIADKAKDYVYEKARSHAANRAKRSIKR